MPAVYAGKPENEDAYHYTEVDGLKVYIDKYSPMEQDGLQIDLKGIGIFKKPVIEGFLV